MTTTIDLHAAIFAAMESIDADGYEVIAIRRHDDAVAVGEIFDDSRVWIDGDPTDDTLNGVCGLQIKAPNSYFGVSVADCVADKSYARAIAAIQTYSGSRISIIGGAYYERGEDVGEIIIQRGVCLATIAA